MADNTQLHTALCKTIHDYVFYSGGWCKKMLGTLGMRRGLADIDGFLCDPATKRPIAFYIEVKTGKGELSKDQRTIRDEIVARGGLYIEAHSVDDVEDRFVSEGLALRRLLR